MKVQQNCLEEKGLIGETRVKKGRVKGFGEMSSK